MDMGIPFQRATKGMEDTDKSGNEIFGFVHPVKHAKYNGADGIEQTIQAGAVFQEIRSEFFRDRKNAMPVVAVDQFACHGSCPFPGVKVAASRTETGMAAKRDEVEVTALRTAVHGTAERRIATVDHLINVFNLRGTGMKSIYDFFIMIAEDFLKYIHGIIMQKKTLKSKPTPHD